MHATSSPSTHPFHASFFRALCASSLIAVLAACGGGSSDSSNPALAAASSAAAAIRAPIAPITPIASATGSTRPVPTNIADGDTVSLACGVTYQGSLDLNGKKNVTVNTLGSCGKARITPGRAIAGFSKGAGSVYSAPVDFTPIQVAVGGVFVSPAHWPNEPWAASASGMPSSDLTGATQVYLDNQSVVKSQKLASDSLASSKPFYVEGKLWMLDSPGEWAISGGRLYIWTADGGSPEGKTWASPDAVGINADHSSGVKIDSVSIFSATDGISADSSANLSVVDVDIDNSYRDGIWASGSSGLNVSGSSISNARRNGIDGWYWIENATIFDTSVANTGMVGMPSATDAGIMFGDGRGNRVESVRVTHSGYHGVSVLHNRDTRVVNSLIDGACARLTDCGGIYTGARDQLPLGLLIENNTVSNATGTQGIGIYLDDFANGVTISKNIVKGNTQGIVLHNAFGNAISNNTVGPNAVANLAFGQDSGNIRDNAVTYDTFISTGGQFNYNQEAGSNLKTFFTADHNTYASDDVSAFSRYWDGKSDGVTQSYASWKAWSGLDAHSTMNGR